MCGVQCLYSTGVEALLLLLLPTHRVLVFGPEALVDERGLLQALLAAQGDAVVVAGRRVRTNLPCGRLLVA